MTDAERTDAERLLADLDSDDEEVVIRALHTACPCSGDDTFFVRHQRALRRLERDARPAVREVAKHLQRDAIDEMRQEDERAAGFDRNPRGGFGPKGQPRRADVRQGWR